MGFFSDITDTLLGGTDDSAQKAQQGLNKEAIQFIKDQLARSRGEISQGYPAAMDARLAGSQATADLLGGSAGARYSPFMQGNMNAQQTLSGMGSQIQNALMGLPIDYGFTQPQQVTPDTSWMNVTLPQNPASGGLASLLQDPQAEEQAPPPAQEQPQLHIDQILSMRGRNPLYTSPIDRFFRR